MVSFFRRKKPESSERRYSTEELAAAFPDAQPPTREREEEKQQVEPEAKAPTPSVPAADPSEPGKPGDTAPAADAPEPDTTAAPVAVEAPAPVRTLAPEPDYSSWIGQTTDKPAAPAGKRGWRERLHGSGFARSFGGLFYANPKLDDALLDDIETALITADVGMTATTEVVEGLRKRMKSREFADAQALLKALRE